MKITKLPNGGELYEYVDGNKEYFLNGKRHRTDGPAIIDDNGYKEWYIHGFLHREDGPAVEFANNGGIAFYLNGIFISSQEEFKRLLKLKAFW